MTKQKTNKRISQSRIEKILKKKWQYLVSDYPAPSNINIPDNVYWKLTIKSARQIHNQGKQYNYKYIPSLHDCDNFALSELNFYQNYRYYEAYRKEINSNQYYNYTCFICWGAKFNGKPMGHAINGVITEKEEILFHEPQSTYYNYWKADTDRDTPYFFLFL